jgi:hypothetical protein
VQKYPLYNGETEARRGKGSKLADDPGLETNFQVLTFLRAFQQGVCQRWALSVMGRLSARVDEARALASGQTAAASSSSVGGPPSPPTTILLASDSSEASEKCSVH